ncbi:MAG: hypothetical protein H6712_29510 [Myxococcales bacterium]|nr:hypothetical protein [Myxococcales bacterium]MCB9718024.1 hypothetical protein [Myxococcales bacterium]
MPAKFTLNGDTIDERRFKAMKEDRSAVHIMSLVDEHQQEESHAFTNDGELDEFARHHPRLKDSFKAAKHGRDVVRRHLAAMTDEQLSAYRDALDAMATATDPALERMIAAMFPGGSPERDGLKAFLGPKSGTVEFFDYTSYGRKFHSAAGMFHLPMPYLGSWDNHLSSLRLYGPVSIQLFDGPAFTGSSRIYGAWPFQTRSISLSGDWFNNRTSSWLFHM